jgi:O-antigen/teichoic acid export membrane protein
VGAFVNASDAAAVLNDAFHLGLIGLALMMLGYAVGDVNQGLHRPVLSGSITLAGSVAAMVVTIVLLLKGHGLVALPAGLVARGVVMVSANVIGLMWWFRTRLRQWPVFVPSDVAGLVRLSGMVFVGRIGGVLIYRMDAFLAAKLLSPTESAVLVVSGRLLDMAKAGTDRIAGAIAAPLAHLAGSGDRQKVRKVVDDLLMASSGVAAVGCATVVALNPDFVRVWVGQGVFGGRVLTLAIGLAVLGSIVSNLQNQALFAMGGVRASSITMLLEAAVRLPLQITLTVSLGIVGLPLGSFLASLATGLILFPRALDRALYSAIGTTRSLVIRRLALACTWALAGAIVGWAAAPLDLGRSWPRVIAGGFCVLIAAAGALWAIDSRVRGVVRSRVLPLLGR